LFGIEAATEIALPGLKQSFFFSLKCTADEENCKQLHCQSEIFENILTTFCAQWITLKYSWLCWDCWYMLPKVQ